MKVPVLLVRNMGNGELRAADIVTDDYLAEVARGKELHVKSWFPRNPKFHRLAMSYLHHVAENQDRFDDLEDLMMWLKIRVGHFTLFHKDEISCPKCGHHFGGTVYRLLDSIDFGSMDEKHFRRFMRRVEYLVMTELIPGLDIKTFEVEVLKTVASYEGVR